MVYELQVKNRKELGKKVNKLKAEGLVPAIIYGQELKENLPILLSLAALEKVFNEAGESTLINLTIEGEKEPREVLLKDIAYDPVSEKPIHADFLQIKRGQKLEFDIELNFVGIAPAVKELGGIVIKSMDSVSVRCLPKDMISSVDVDLTRLKTFDDKILIKDLAIPAAIEILEDMEEAVAVVSVPIEEKFEEASATIVEPEVVGKEKKESEGEEEKSASGGKEEPKKGKE